VDEAAIKRVLAMYVETWNRQDMKSWGELFTDDVDYINRAGGWWQSNKENVEGHKTIHEELKKQKQRMTYRASVAKINFLKSDIALVHAKWEWPGFVAMPGEKAGDFGGMMTLVMVKQDGRWLIRALQNTVCSDSAAGALEIRNGDRR
jgi:uncharacterized protein (TIGR02246 family)